jgi:hypothetical protein
MKEFAEGNKMMPGPGKNVVAFCRCEERRDEAISKRAA